MLAGWLTIYIGKEEIGLVGALKNPTDIYTSCSAARYYIIFLTTPTNQFYWT